MSHRNKDILIREREFADKVNKLGKFIYVGGYYNIKGNVKVIHKKCGCETTMRAYAVAYSDIDKCHECGRQKREYNKCKRYIEACNEDIEVIHREKDNSGKNRYYVRCKKCGDTFHVAYDKLRDGEFKCCSESVGAYERVSKNKAKEIYKKIKEDAPKMSEKQLYHLVYAVVEKDVYLAKYKGLHDTERLAKEIVKYILNRLEKEKVAYCSVCGELKTGVVGWGRREANYKSKICIECAKATRKCSVCGEEKKINTYATDENGAYLDVCCRCNNKKK